MKRISVFGLIATALVLAACSAQPTPTPIPPLPTSTTQAIATPTPLRPTVALSPTTPVPTSSSGIVIGDADNAKTFTAAVGARVQIVLHSTYWQFENLTSTQVLRQTGQPIVVPDTTSKIPGTGAGTVTIEFQAIAPGQVAIKASRTTCGEALLCSDAQRAFQVTVIVK